MQSLFLPPNVGVLARLCTSDSSRFATAAVHLQALDDGGYRIDATDGKRLAIVVGTEPQTPEYPCLEEAANGAYQALIGAKDWLAEFKSVKSIRRGGQPLGVVMAGAVTSVASGNSLSQLTNVEGRFPATEQVVADTRPVFTIQVNARLLAELLLVAAAFAPDDQAAPVTLGFMAKDKPFTVRLCNDTQEFLGIMVPLTPP